VGEECVEGRCVVACDSGIRCGEDLDVCCEADQVCVAGSCETPVGSCLDSYDCEEGYYCEPVLDQCLPQPEEVECVAMPDFEDFDVTTEWEWTGWSEDDAYHNISTTPVVADLDLDDLPEVGFIAYTDGYASGMIAVLDGEDGSEDVMIDPAEYDSDGRWGIAFGQIDGDDELEIVGPVKGRGLVAFENDGTFKWERGDGSFAEIASSDVWSYPGVADLDADGRPEVFMGGAIVDGATGDWVHDGGWLGCNASGSSHPWCISTAADLDGDDMLEIVGGDRAIELDGTVLWSDSENGDGFPAVGDIELDGDPDVVVITDGQMILREGIDGAILLGPLALPGGGRGGPPTIGDFDGDGWPEFSLAGQGYYTVFDIACEGTPDPALCATERTDHILWSRETQDLSSSITGSSLFDFNGDGAVEVVYNDECHLYVYDGSSGEILLSMANSSRTAMENPVVADADGDNNSEFLVAANNDEIDRDGCDPPGQYGLKCFGDPEDRWVRTRPFWNEHDYHVTNITSSGGTPAPETANWEVDGLNNFRQNVQGEGVFNAPDLVVDLEVNMASCPTGCTLTAVVRNTGSLGVVAGVEVGFYLGVPSFPLELLGTLHTTKDLLPGASERLELDVTFPGDVEPPWDFFVIVDDHGPGGSGELECDEDNNVASIADVSCDMLI
jgi:hypothetical protein